MINDNKTPVKCENAPYVQNCKRLLNTSNVDIISFILETPELFFWLTFNKFLFFFGRKPMFHFFVAVVYYTFLHE